MTKKTETQREKGGKDRERDMKMAYKSSTTLIDVFFIIIFLSLQRHGAPSWGGHLGSHEAVI